MPIVHTRKSFAVARQRGLPAPLGAVTLRQMSDDQHDDGNDSRRPALIGLAVVAALIVIGYFLMMSLREESNREDCLMSGRTNCAPIETPGR